MAPKKQQAKKPQPKKEYDYSGLEKGMRLQAESDGSYYAAEVVQVSTAKNRSKAPVKISFVGYEGYDEWVAGDRLRSKTLKVTVVKEARVAAKTLQAEHDEQQAILNKQKPSERVFSIADQVGRFARSKKEIRERQYYNHPEQYYDRVKEQLKGKRVLITGAEQGLGLELVKLIVAEGGHAIQAGRNSSPDLDAVAEKYPGQVTIINGIDVTKDAAMAKMCEECKEPVDIVMNSAGYFYGPTESVGVGCEGHMNFDQQMLQINICAVGPLRITNALYKAGKIVEKGKVIIITSQAGSCDWRFTQNGTPKPGEAFDGNYGHHMSRAACNIMGVILSQELKAADLSVQMMHPGFNRTAMTKKYEHIWDIEGAVEPIVGAKRVLFQTLKSSIATTGSVINCEDGLRIPW